MGRQQNEEFGNRIKRLFWRARAEAISQVKHNNTRTQAKSIGLVAIVNLINAVVGILQAFIVGRLFGTSPGIEIFFAASVLVVALSKLLQAGQIAEIFTPIYHQLKAAKGPLVAFELQAVLLNWLLVCTASVSVIMVLGAYLFVPLSVPGFTEDRVTTCVFMFQTLAPIAVLRVTQFTLANLLINEKYFVAREITTTCAAVLSLLTIALCANQFDVWAMVAAQWASSVLTLIAFFVLLTRLGYRHCFRLRHESFPVSTVFKKLPSVLGYVCVTQLYAVILTAGISTLPQGTLAVYTYATRLYSRVSGILVRPVSTVFFSHFSSALAAGDTGIKKITVDALRLVLLLSTVTCVLVITTGLPMLKAIWLSPSFPESRIWLTYVTFSALCFIPILSSMGLIFRKINMAHQYTHSQYLILIVNQIVAAVLAYTVIPTWGLYGAIAVLIGNAAFSAFASSCLLLKTRPKQFAVYDRKTVLQCIILFGLTVFPLLSFRSGLDTFGFQPNSTLGYFLTTGLMGLLTVGMLVVIAHFLRISELRSVANMVQRKLKGVLGIQ